MRLSERVIVERLFTEAKRQGFKCTKIVANGCDSEDKLEAGNITHGMCLGFAREYDADSVVLFTRGKEWFWVLLVWGNGEDVISDYSAVRYADQVIDPVYAWINDAEETR